jgi:hypothetical protein
MWRVKSFLIGVRGASYVHVAPSRSGAGKARRSTLPLGLSGMR